jgi:hypothetical protein
VIRRWKDGGLVTVDGVVKEEFLDLRKAKGVEMPKAKQKVI